MCKVTLITAFVLIKTIPVFPKDYGSTIIQSIIIYYLLFSLSCVQTDIKLFRWCRNSEDPSPARLPPWLQNPADTPASPEDSNKQYSPSSSTRESGHFPLTGAAGAAPLNVDAAQSDDNDDEPKDLSPKRRREESGAGGSVVERMAVSPAGQHAGGSPSYSRPGSSASQGRQNYYFFRHLIISHFLKVSFYANKHTYI